MATKPMQEVEFWNFDLPYPTNLYFREEVPADATQLFAWMETLCKGEFCKFSLGYNERSHSFTATCTYKGGKTTEPAPCVTLHGSNTLSALKKLYVVVQLLGCFTLGKATALNLLDKLNEEIGEGVVKVMENRR